MPPEREDTGLWDPEPGFLNTASYGLPPRPAFAAVQTMLEQWRTGRTSWEAWDHCVDQARERFAGLVNVPAADVAIGATVSELLGLVATALPPGATVLVPEGEFSSTLFPWLVRAGQGVDVTTVPLDRLAAAIDGRTTLVAFSLVQSASGQVSPAAEITAAARQHGALVVVDATQACGWLPVDATAFDALVAHAYKWLMSPRGSSFLYLRPSLRERMQPWAASWYAGADRASSYYGPPMHLAEDARRFDTSPAWVSWVGTAPALEVIEQIGVPVIHEHNVRLANRLRTGLGLPPGDSAIVSADIPGAEVKLARAGIRASARAGRTRLACHIYTTEQDVDAAVDALGDGAAVGDGGAEAGRDA
jgi:selenocysteine lyase/cysteine desulfurase